jgi:glycosyltransferase involved in cell wall biosynthesis
MKKILFVTTRFPLDLYGGDKDRALGIIQVLSENNNVDIVCLSEKKHTNFKNKLKNRIKIFRINKISRILTVIKFIFLLKPMQLGFYFSTEMKKYINENSKNYDSIIFHTIRAAQYLPVNFSGKKILEMTDIISLNYKKTSNYLSFYNILKYIYLFEMFLVKKYENYISNFFYKIILVSHNDIKESKNLFFKKKIQIIKSGININRKIFNFKKNNNKILFLGNINYLPNKIACKDFITKIMPTLYDKDKKISFHVIGPINNFNQRLFKKYKNVKIHGAVKNLNEIFKKSFCAINNVKIATGYQNKILTYMSYGIPVISYKKYPEFNDNCEVIYYKNDIELINKIIELKKKKYTANKISTRSYSMIKRNFSWEKRASDYVKIL